MGESSGIEVEVVYALPSEQWLTRVLLPARATVGDAIEQSGLLVRYPQISEHALRVGIFGQRVSLDAQVGPADRVEVYRLLTVDPKEARRRRARLRLAKAGRG